MAEANDNAIQEINGKPIVASTCFEEPIYVNSSVEKVFGLMVKSNNKVIQFRLLIESDERNGDGFIEWDLKLIRLSNDPIDCRIPFPVDGSNDNCEIVENMTVFIEKFEDKFDGSFDPSHAISFYVKIEVCFSHSRLSQIPSKEKQD